MFSGAALKLAEKLPGDITLLNVVRDMTRQPMVPYSMHADMARLSDQAIKEHGKLLQQMQEKHPKVKRIVVRKGDEAEVIEQEQLQHELTVMGTKGASGLSSLLLGSITLKVLRKHAGPVITVRSVVPEHIRKMVVGVDGSDVSLRVVEFARSLAQEMSGVSVVGVHVFPEEVYPDQREFLESSLKRFLMEKQCPDCHLIPGKSPVAGLVSFAEKEGADIIGVATRGLSGITDVLGSTTLGVLQAWEGPVLVL